MMADYCYPTKYQLATSNLRSDMLLTLASLPSVNGSGNGNGNNALQARHTPFPICRSPFPNYLGSSRALHMDANPTPEQERKAPRNYSRYLMTRIQWEGNRKKHRIPGHRFSSPAVCGVRILKGSNVKNMGPSTAR